MAVTIRQNESAPDSYPTTSPAIALNDVAWQRVEAWIAHRFASRTVTWIVEGPGEWSPPLTPAAITTVEVWCSADIWETATLTASPLGGYYLRASGPYRFTATVGDDDADVPATVWEAVKRLSAYLTAKTGKAGARSENIQAGSITIGYARDPAWMAHAMANSGAADLLRAYRHV